MAKVELKQPIVDEIANSIKDAQAVVLVNYSGLTVEQDTILRKELREAGVQYKVYKNTMMNRAFAGTACESLCPHLEGTNALAISATDATVRILYICIGITWYHIIHILFARKLISKIHFYLRCLHEIFCCCSVDILLHCFKELFHFIRIILEDTVSISACIIQSNIFQIFLIKIKKTKFLFFQIFFLI